MPISRFRSRKEIYRLVDLVESGVVAAKYIDFKQFTKPSLSEHYNNYLLKYLFISIQPSQARFAMFWVVEGLRGDLESRV